MTYRIHLAKTGSFVDGGGRSVAVDAALLAEMADSYDPEAHKAPLVLGHPADGAPAYGWIDKLEVGADGDLYGDVSQIAPELADAVKAGNYRNVSISWWPKGHANSPNKDKVSFRHLAILGAQAPVVKGLTPLQFAEDDAIVTVEFSDTKWGWIAVKDMARGIREFIIENFGTEKADRVVPSYLIDEADSAADAAEDAEPTRFADAAPKPGADPAQTKLTPEKEATDMPDDDKKPVDLAEREAALAEREAKVAAAEAEAAAAATAAQKTAAITFADELIAAGKLAPAGKDVIVSIHQRLAASDEPITFADDTKKPALTAFTDLLSAAKPVIVLSEVSKDDASSGEIQNTAKDIGKRAAAIRKEDPTIDMAESVRMAEKEAANG